MLPKIMLMPALAISLTRTAHLLETAAGDVDFADGWFTVAGNTKNAEPFRRVPIRANGGDAQLWL